MINPRQDCAEEAPILLPSDDDSTNFDYLALFLMHAMMNRTMFVVDSLSRVEFESRGGAAREWRGPNCQRGRMDPSHGLSQYAPGGMLSPGKMQTVEELRDALRLSMKELIAVQVRVLLFPTKKTQLTCG